MYLRFPEGKDKTVTLSYDDGVVFDIRLIEIMQQYGLKGTFNINTGLYLSEDAERTAWSGRMKLSEAKKLYSASGNEVAVHSLTHPFLEQLSTAEMIYEIVEDRKHIEQVYGTLARGMAYPFGTYDERVMGVLQNCGICYARTVKSTGDFSLPENWLALHPTCHHKDTRLMSLATQFLEGRSYGRVKMFYLWGHSYEFQNDNNWHVIEEFAKYMGNREDVWYATNIEIYDYVQAYRALRTSYDCKIIHNPSAVDVWIFLEGETLRIPSGETLYR